MRAFLRSAGLAAGLAAGLGPLAYLLFFRRGCLTWGARDDEVASRLPGDELLPGAGLVTTRAVTIGAPPDAIWPWLAQMGSGRGGAYTYDWIENLLGLDMHSADTILPQFQDVKAGDELPMGPGRPAMRIEVLDRPRALALRFADQNWVWIFALAPEDASTRLISRNRIATASLSPFSRLFYALVMEPGSLIMERKMLLGIKQRAERVRVSGRGQPVPRGHQAAGTWPAGPDLTRPCALGPDWLFTRLARRPPYPGKVAADILTLGRLPGRGAAGGARWRPPGAASAAAA